MGIGLVTMVLLITSPLLIPEMVLNDYYYLRESAVLLCNGVSGTICFNEAPEIELHL